MANQAEIINNLHRYLAASKTLFTDMQDYYLFGYLAATLSKQYSIHKAEH